MWSRPALPNICGAGGDCSGSRISNIRIACLSSALVRSVYLTPSEPGSIFSKPSASAQSTRPPFTAWRARKSAEEPVEQVERPLAVGRVAVAVAGVGLLDVRIGNAGVGERLGPRLFGPVGVVALLGTGLLELGHPDPDHERAVAQSLLLCLRRLRAAFGWLAKI